MFITFAEEDVSVCAVNNMSRLGYSVVSLSSWNRHDLIDRNGVTKRSDFNQFCEIFG